MMRLNLFHRKKQGYLLVQRCNEISSLIIQESNYGNLYKPMFLIKHPKAPLHLCLRHIKVKTSYSQSFPVPMTKLPRNQAVHERAVRKKDNVDEFKIYRYSLLLNILCGDAQIQREANQKKGRFLVTQQPLNW